MINILIPCTPNYKGRNVINTVNKGIDIVTQFIVLYKSIKKNWKTLNYRISLFHNKNYLFNDFDRKRLSELDIDIFAIEPDYGEPSPYMVRCNAFIHKLKKRGSHRLFLEPDTIALSEPTFDLLCDWQAMYASSSGDLLEFNYINKKYNFNLDLKKYRRGDLLKTYIEKDDSTDLFPHFNMGAHLIREELCATYSKMMKPCYNLCEDNNLSDHGKHIGVQYAMSLASIKLSNNWKPFERGFNYPLKQLNAKSFEIDNIKLLHYCGIGGGELAVEHFKEYFDV